MFLKIKTIEGLPRENAFVYFVQSSASPYLVAIGHTQSVSSKKYQLQRSLRVPVTVLFAVWTWADVVQVIAQRFSSSCVSPGWYQMTPELRMFIHSWKTTGSLPPDVIEQLQDIYNPTLPPWCVRCGKKRSLPSSRRCDKCQGVKTPYRKRKPRRPSMEEVLDDLLRNS